MLRRLLVLLVLASIAPLLGGTASAEETTDGTAADATRTTWSIRPATAEGPDGRVSVRQEMDPGGLVTEHVTVTNHGTAPATFDLYASDGVITDDGGFDLLPADTPPTGSGSWIDVVDRVEVPAAGEVTVPVTISVPADATPGDHPAGVVAALSGTTADGQGQQVTVDSRVGVRVHLRVAGDLVAGLAVTDVQVDHLPSWNPFTPGRVEVSYTVVNEGNVRLGADPVAVAVGGATAAGAAQREVLPGDVVRDTVVVDGVWPLLRRSGDVTVQPVVVGDDVVEVPVAADGAQFTVWTPPWAQLAVLVLVVGLLLLVRALRRRSRARFERALDQARAEGAAREQVTAGS